jgi:hypothetical protein
MSETVKDLVESRIKQLVFEPPANLFFVQVKITSSSIVEGRVVGEVYRVTLCGVGGKPLVGEKEFLLFQTGQEEPLRLQYITKKSDS